MAKTQNKISGVQGDIFRQLEDEPADSVDQGPIDLEITLELRGACATAMKFAERRGVSRERLADELNRLMPYLSAKITKRKIDAWMAKSKEDHPMPAYVIPAFCVATKCDLPLRVMAQSINYELADQRELLAQELGMAEIERAAKTRHINSIKSRLGQFHE